MYDARTRWLRNRFAVACLAAGAAIFGAAAFAASAPAADSSVEDALLRGDWTAVLRATHSPSSPDSVRRALRGHALLALDRNGDSVCEFGAFAKDAQRGRDAWATWTASFSARHPQAAVAHYLHADALARSGKRAAALEAFSRGLELRPGDAMLLNARGVVFAVERRYAEAVVDFHHAATAAKPLADVMANQGVVALLQRQSADAARSKFERALAASPGFALARIGRAGAYIAEGNTKAAEIDAQVLKKSGTCLSQALRESVVRAMRTMELDRQSSAASLDDKEVGAAIMRKVSQVERGDMRALRELADIAGAHPQSAPHIRNELQRVWTTSPEMFQKIGGGLSRLEREHSATGSVRLITSMLRDAKGSSTQTVEGAIDIKAARVGGSQSSSITITPKATAQFFDARSDLIHKGASSLLPQQRPEVFPEGPIGGATSNSAHARWDLAELPPFVEFGLLYPWPDEGAR